MSVARSIVENKSSPTVLMRVLTGFSSDVLVVSPFGIPVTVDSPLIPVTSNAVIARTVSFRRFVIFVFTWFRPMLEYMECYIRQYFRNSTLSDLDMSQNDTNSRDLA